MEETERRRVAEARERWEQKVLAPLMANSPEIRPAFRTASGLPVARLYAPDREGQREYLEGLGFPGEYPFTRGVHPTMYRGRLWTMRQYAGFASAEESNRRYRFLLDQGQSGLSVAFDLPTQVGYDSDHPLACGEVGRVGVAIDSLDDMELLFAGIPLDRVSTSMTINAPAAIILAMYVAVAERQGVPLDKLEGTIQNDILKEYAARGTYIFPPGPSMRLVTDVFEYCYHQLPQWNTISISGYHIREAGSTAIQEVAFTLANAVSYVRAATAKGLDVNKFGPRLSFFFSSHTDFFEEVAKFRAARRLWARLMREELGATNPRAWTLRFHTQTAGSTLTAQQPDNNVVRVTLQALAAVLGGTQSLHTNARDEALSLPSEASARLALRTQQIIACESGVTASIDPLGGAYWVEELTDAIEAQAREYIQRIETMGGAPAAIEVGYMQREIQESAYAYQRSLEAGDRKLVGINAFATPEEPPADLWQVEAGVEARQRARLERRRRERDTARVERCLEEVRRAAAGRDNLVPRFLEAVKAQATLGELCDVLRSVFGEYRQPSV
ncbi:MAG TPA: methylmalonyl-CoA mutase [Clostridiales bacterium UBA8153]|nr:methylmalonyl-CoA mutase [Clostridiales bacterium UBA8153]